MPEFPLIETFAALSELTGLKHGFLLRSPEADVDCDREEALARLMPLHTSLLASAGISRDHLATGEQVHEARVGIVAGAHPARLHFPATDALVTAIPGQYLGVWVADCGTVFSSPPASARPPTRSTSPRRSAKTPSISASPPLRSTTAASAPRPTPPAFTPTDSKKAAPAACSPFWAEKPDFLP
jgi:hypothetical protein